jgi:ubiquinone/menaquinone biosynthesis C-methylase UbiE
MFQQYLEKQNMSNYLTTNFDLNNKDLVSVIDELPLWSAPFGLKLLDKINYHKNITALDIGSGSGFPLLEVAMRLGNSCKLYGIDPWEAAVERTRSKIKIYGINNVELMTGVAEEVPLPDNSAELIFSNNGLNNVGDIEKVLNECRRISKPGAQLVFTYNTDKTMYEFYSVFEEVLLENNLHGEIELMKQHIYKKRRPVEEFVRLLNDNNFAVQEVSPFEFEYRFTDGTSLFNHFLIRLAFIESWKNILPESSREEIFLEIENRLNAVSDNDHALKLTVPFVVISARKK